MKIKQLKPNFFLAFKVCNSEIQEKVKKIQEKIIALNPVLHSALIDISTLHITLAVTHLASENEIEDIKNRLGVWAEKNKTELFSDPILLSFCKIKTFQNVVAYVDMEKTSDYQKMCNISESLNTLLSSNGYNTDKRSFNPHLTILKLSRNHELLKYKKSFQNEFEVLKECTDHFGEQKVKSIQLLSMNKEGNYYKCFHEIKTNNFTSDCDEDCSKCCVPVPEPKIDT